MLTTRHVVRLDAFAPAPTNTLPAIAAVADRPHFCLLLPFCVPQEPAGARAGARLPQSDSPVAR